jgi:hypothetical protein
VVATDSCYLERVLENQLVNKVLGPVGGADGWVEIDPAMYKLEERRLLLREVDLIIDVGSDKGDVEGGMGEGSL